MTVSVGNILASIPEQLPEELFETIFKQGKVHIERIVSQGHITPAQQWYDQAWDEWVLVLQGRALLRYEDERQDMSLAAGDYVLIPAHCRHRVEWTASEPKTVWLAVHVYI